MRDLPPLPTAVAKVIELTRNPNATAGQIEQYIAVDQAISSKVLRVVNSPYFGLAGQVASISQAVVILGFDQCRNLVLSLSSGNLFPSKTPDAKAIQVDLWRHAFATAAGAQIIARFKRVDPKDQDLVFSGGLLSNVGALFLASQFPMPYMAIFTKYRNDAGLLFELEDAGFGTNHAEIGQQLCGAWKLPEALVLMVGRHEGKFAGDPIPTVYCVHAADRLASALTNNRKVDLDAIMLDPEVKQWLQIGPEDWNHIVGQTGVKLEEASDMLGLF
ncbi:MAG: HDOD domain-containing protein [Armatimonadetes bacterium]|nr:HDOD domain-containing protein [Armatimonadota bacterium]